MGKTSALKDTPRVLVGVPLEREAGKLLSKYAEFAVQEFIKHDALVNEIGKYDGLISGGAQCDEAVFAVAERLKVVSSHGIGYDTIDVDAATRHGVMVTNAPGVMAESVAEHALALMLAAARRITQADRDVKHLSASWAKYRGVELWGKTIGQIGMGRIGWLIARKARDAFNMTVLGYDPYVEAERILTAGAVPVPLDRLLASSDVISLSVPLNEDTRDLISKEELSLMREGAILINTARAGIVNENDLIAALKQGSIGWAGLDVFETELGGKSELMELDNVVLTPHQGANTVDGFAAIARATVENLLMALQGNCPKNILNPSVCAEKS